MIHPRPDLLIGQEIPIVRSYLHLCFRIYAKFSFSNDAAHFLFYSGGVEVK